MSEQNIKLSVEAPILEQSKGGFVQSFLKKIKDNKMAKQTNYIAKTPDANGVINYSEEEHSVWSDLFNQQKANIQHYC